MTWVISTPRIGMQAIADISTTQNHPLGTIVQAKDPTYGQGEFIYLAGAASTAARDWVTYNPSDGSTARLAANAIGPVAVAMGACTASYYGWYQIEGVALGACLTQYASGARAWATGTAGAVDDTSVAGDGLNIVKGASTTAVGSGYAIFEISRPWVNDNTSFS